MCVESIIFNMSTRYKENNFSIENISTPLIVGQDKIDSSVKTNVVSLKKIMIEERKRETSRNIVTLGIVVLSIILIFIFF